MGVTIKGRPLRQTKIQLKGPVALTSNTNVVCSRIVDPLLTMVKEITTTNITTVIIITTIATRLVQAVAEIVATEVEKPLPQRAQITMTSLPISTQHPKGTTIICPITTSPPMIIEATRLEEVIKLAPVALTTTIATTREIIITTIRTLDPNHKKLIIPLSAIMPIGRDLIAELTSSQVKTLTTTDIRTIVRIVSTTIESIISNLEEVEQATTFTTRILLTLIIQSNSNKGIGNSIKAIVHIEVVVDKEIEVVKELAALDLVSRKSSLCLTKIWLQGQTVTMEQLEHLDIQRMLVMVMIIGEAVLAG